MTEPEHRAPGEQAVEYLQHAAIEAIKAWRRFLDIAETVVREPETAAAVGRAFADAAASVLRPGSTTEKRDDHDGADEVPPAKVRRIVVD